MCINEFRDAVEAEYKQTHEWNELQNKAEEEGKDLEEAWGKHEEIFADNVYADLQPLVEGWIMRHGCQITEVLTEELEAMEGEEEDETA